jgi:gliding motility-associated-like protein
MIKYIYILFLLLLGSKSYGQCKNADLSTGTFWGWSGASADYQGGVLGPFIPTNIVLGALPIVAVPNNNLRHQIVNIGAGPQVYDPKTCNIVSKTPPGYSTSLKLGNELPNSNNNSSSPFPKTQYDVAEYTMSVSPANNLLLYRFAAIFEDPGATSGHNTIGERPALTVNVIEKATGALVNVGNASCATETFYANPADPLLRNCIIPRPGSIFNDTIYYRGWTTVGIDLSAYESLPAPNNEITLQFIVHDCFYGGHFGYAYVSAECDKLDIEVQYCQNANQAVLTAPEGFNYLWSNGATSQVIYWPNPVPGQLVSVQLITKSGCISNLQTTLEPSNINADFSALDVCEGNNVVFTDLSTAADFAGNPILITNFTWDFGDGSPISTSQNPIHTYANAGSYLVTLIAETEKGCIDTVTKTVNIWPTPIPNFIAADGCIHSSVFFDDTSSVSSGFISSWQWNFDDSTTTAVGNLSTQSNPSHTYDSAGTYYPELIVSSNQGCIDTVTIPLQIHALPLASFTYQENCKGQLVSFLDASTANSGAIQSWLWNFGNGANAITQNPQTIFASSVDYIVHLLVTNSFGCIDDTSITIPIVAPEADFTTDTSCYEQSTDFFDQSIGNIVAWNWDFGGGNTSAQQFPSHIFDLPGTHIINLTVTSAEGCIAQKTKTIFVFDKPVVKFVADIYEGCPELCVQFTDFTTCSDPIVQWTWGIDSIFYSVNNPIHCFTDSGFKDVSLIATSNQGCVDTLKKEDLIYVYHSPTADYIFSPQEVYVNNPEVSFVNQSIDAISYSWTFDYLGSASAIDTTILFPFDVPYIYNVCLKAIAANGCEDTTCKKVPVLGLFDFYASNTFTPNKDGVNDTFKPIIVGGDPSFYEFFVYNRWGNLIFYTQNYEEEWDGKYKGEIVKDDVYVWEVKTRELSSGEYRNYFGHILALIFKK